MVALLFQKKILLFAIAPFVMMEYFGVNESASGEYFTQYYRMMYCAGLVTLILLHWLRYFPWTHSLFPRFMQANYIAKNGDWEELTPVRADTSRWLVVKGAWKFYKNRKIPFLEFIEAYRHGHIDITGDMFEVLMERDEWTIYTLTWYYLHFIVTGYIPDVAFHTRAQDEAQVTEHYDRGNDFFGWYLGHRMTYTSGYFITGDETLETSQDQKIQIVLRKIQLEENQNLLDIGCGWGTLAIYAARHFGANVTGVTISKNQVEFANARAAEYKVSDKVEFLCHDYRDIPKNRVWDRITCLEMAEHVGIKNFSKFLRQVKSMLTDEGIFYLQIAGLRERWLEEDLCWGVFMNKYIFPGADASLPLNWVLRQLETVGFEVHTVETIGVHYADCIYRWYTNWLTNKDDIIKAYGETWYRTWLVFLAHSSILPAQGGAKCYQIVCFKDINEYDRRRFYGEGYHVYDVDPKEARL